MKRLIYGIAVVLVAAFFIYGAAAAATAVSTGSYNSIAGKDVYESTAAQTTNNTGIILYTPLECWDHSVHLTTNGTATVGTVTVYTRTKNGSWQALSGTIDISSLAFKSVENVVTDGFYFVPSGWSANATWNATVRSHK